MHRGELRREGAQSHHQLVVPNLVAVAGLNLLGHDLTRRPDEEVHDARPSVVLMAHRDLDRTRGALPGECRRI
jgi:hypothetical protein